MSDDCLFDCVTDMNERMHVSRVACVSAMHHELPTSLVSVPKLRVHIGISTNVVKEWCFISEDGRETEYVEVKLTSALTSTQV